MSLWSPREIGVGARCVPGICCCVAHSKCAHSNEGVVNGSNTPLSWIKHSVWLCVFASSVALFPAEAWARAGGGGGGGGGIINVILIPLCIAYSLWVSYLVFKKNRESQRALERAKVDACWNPDSLKDRIKFVYFKVQEAWMARDQNIAMNCLSKKLFQDHKRQTDLMIQNGTINVLEDIHLAQARIVEVLDFDDNSKDQFWVHIAGSMIDYTINEKTGDVLSGKKNKSESFKELWKFVRTGHGWVLDEIDSSVHANDLLGMNSMTES